MKQTVTPKKYTLGEAAKATGKSKPTISRALKRGDISGTKNKKGEFELDPAEVHRIYPRVTDTSNDNGNSDGNEKQSDTPNNSSELQAQVELLREMVERGDSERARLETDRDHWRDQAQKVTALIEDNRAGGGFLSRLFKK